jgi:hypothetical protein
MAGPASAICGSLNTTASGARRGRMRTSGKRPALSPAIRPFVGRLVQQRAVLVHIAGDEHRAIRHLHAAPVVDRDALRRSKWQRGVFKTQWCRHSVGARWRQAASRSVPRARCRRDSMARITATSSPSRRGSIRCEVRDVKGSSRPPKTRGAISDLQGRIGERADMRSVRPYRRTRTPKRCSACASSRPMTPAPTTATERGRSVQSKMSSLTIKRSPSVSRQACRNRWAVNRSR